MKNQLLVKVTLVANKVDSEQDEWLDYHFPKEKMSKAFEIIKNSLYPYPITQITLSNSPDCPNCVIITLKGPQSVFKKANMEDTGNIYIDTLKSLAYNYGDGGPDGWMEGDIYIDSTHELWIDLVKVEFYKDGQLFLLFDDADDLEEMGSL